MTRDAARPDGEAPQASGRRGELSAAEIAAIHAAVDAMAPLTEQEADQVADIIINSRAGLRRPR